MPFLRLIDFLVKSVRVVPYSIGSRITAAIGLLGYWLCYSERRLALSNIRTCYPNSTIAWRRHLAVRAFHHIVLSAYEILRFAHARQYLSQCLTIENESHLTHELDKGCGVVLITAHYGNVGLLTGVFDTHSPEPAYIMRRSRRKVRWAVAKFREYREKYIKSKTAFRSLESTIAGGLAAAHLLKQGNLLLVAADVTWGAGTVPVNFLGVSYKMSRAPVSLALRTGASLLPVVTFRKDDSTHHVVIEAPIECPVGTPRKIAEKLMMQKFASVLEKYVRLYPEQWFWMHHGSWEAVRSKS